MIWPNQVPVSVVSERVDSSIRGGFPVWRLDVEAGSARVEVVTGSSATVVCQFASKGYRGSLSARLSGLKRRRYELPRPRAMAACYGRVLWPRGPVLRRTIRRSSPRRPAGYSSAVGESLRRVLLGAARDTEGPTTPWSEFGCRAAAYPAAPLTPAAGVRRRGPLRMAGRAFEHRPEAPGVRRGKH